MISLSHTRVAAQLQRSPRPQRAAPHAAARGVAQQRRSTACRVGPAGTDPAAEQQKAAAAAAETEPAAAPQQLSTPQEQAASFGKAILENRRLIAVAVAVADVAFLWVAIKFGKDWWTANH